MVDDELRIKPGDRIFAPYTEDAAPLRRLRLGGEGLRRSAVALMAVTPAAVPLSLRMSRRVMSMAILPTRPRGAMGSLTHDVEGFGTIGRCPGQPLCPPLREETYTRACNSASACSSQNRMSISRYIVVAVVRCSCACSRSPVRR